MIRTTLICSLVALASLGAQSRRPAAVGDWVSYGGTNWSQKYSPLDQITRDNFKSLTVAWSWTSPDFEIVKAIGKTISPPLSATGLKGTPLVVSGVMFMSTGLGQIVALDAATGATKWLYNPESYKDGGSASVVGPWQTRGVAYWSDGGADRRILMGTSDGYLLAVNADTGKPIDTFGMKGKADLYPAIPRASRNTVKMWSGETHYVSPNSPPVFLVLPPIIAWTHD